MHNLGLGLGLSKRYSWAAGGAVSPYDPASDLIFASFVTPPTTARKVLIDRCVRDLKTAGVWAKLDALYGFAAADSQAAKINWINPGTYNCTEINAPAFVADVGFTAASTKYLSTGFTPSSAPSPKFTLNSGCAFGWSNLTNFSAGVMFGGSSAGQDLISVFPTSSGNGYHYSRINTTVGDIALTGLNSKGLWSCSRSASNLTTTYRDGVSIGTTAQASSAVENTVFRFLAASNTYWTGECAAGGIGSNLNATEQAALYQALNAYLAGIAGYAAESGLIFNSFTTTPTTQRKSDIDTYVRALKTAGVWDKLDTLYAFAAADSQAAKVNWKQPGVYNATEVNAPAFTTDRGFTGATTKYIDSNFNPTTATTPKYTQNGASLIGWSLTSTVISTGAIIVQPTVFSYILPLYNASNGYGAITAASTDFAFSNTDGSGLFVATRTGSTASQIYRNSTSIGTSAAVSGAPANNKLLLLTRTGADTWTGQAAIGGFGSQLSAADVAALYNATNAYLSAVGALTSYAAESQAIFSAFTTPPSEARKATIDQCVVALKTAGVWAKLDVLYAFAAADSQASLINWAQPGTYNGVVVNSPVFTADLGWTSAATKEISSIFNPATAPSPKYIQDSAQISAWGLTDVDSSGYLMFETPGWGLIQPRNAGTYAAAINSSSNTSGASTNSVGHWTASRTSAANFGFYKNGVLVNTHAITSAAVASTYYRVGYTWPGTVAGASVGAGLNATEQLALYNALAAYMAGLATDRIAAAFTTPPSAARKTLIQNCVTSLMQGGVWDKLDALYAFAAADSQAAKINWKAPGTYNATEVNAPTFTADRGFTGASTKYLDSNFNASTATTPNFVQNSASAFGWISNNVAGAVLGTVTGPGSILSYPRHSTNCYLVRLNSTPTDTSHGNADSTGFWSISRSGSANVDAYKNGVSQFASAQTSGAVENATIKYLTGLGTDELIGGVVPFGGSGGNLTSADHLALYNALRTYGTGVGVP